MAVLCFAIFSIYGAGPTTLGAFAGIIGWLLFMATGLIASSAWGALTANGQVRAAERIPIGWWEQDS
jgi:hypothetical protein